MLFHLEVTHCPDGALADLVHGVCDERGGLTGLNVVCGGHCAACVGLGLRGADGQAAHGGD